MTRSPRPAQHLGELARLRRVRDRIDREYARPLDVEALARGAHMSAGHLSRAFRLAYGESPYASSLGTFSTRFTELVGAPPSTYRRTMASATAGLPPCVAKQVTRPVRNREAPSPQRQLA